MKEKNNMLQHRLPKIAIIGGTGALGKGLAMRWLAAGYCVVIGTRDVAKATAFIEQLTTDLAVFDGEIDSSQISVLSNLDAAEQADIVVLTVPYSHQRTSLLSIQSGLQGKILIDTTVPLLPPKVAKVQMPSAGSAAQEAQALLNEYAAAENTVIHVVSAFQNVAATHLQSMQDIPCDVLVCGEKGARESVLPHIAAVGVRALSAGPLANAAAQEALTSVLIAINKQYRCHAGIKITALDNSTH